jgi:hypothetical protein
LTNEAAFSRNPGFIQGAIAFFISIMNESFTRFALIPQGDRQT